jgi:hypothetical protein
MPSFADRLNAHPEDTPAEAVYAVADVRLTILAAAQNRNSLKGWFLFAALSFAVAAVACVAVAIFELLAP